jgi:hypothetical protein
MKRESEETIKTSKRFIVALAVVSILGFIGIISETILNQDIKPYIEALWMVVIGVGMIVETKIQKLKTLSEGLNHNNFAHLTTIVVGLLAFVAGIFSLPQIRIENPGFLAIKGIISIIAILVIILQTWIIHKKESC